MTAMRLLVTGRGSIAQRHVRNVRALRPDAAIAILSEGQPAEDLQATWLRDWDAVEAWAPDAVLIASASFAHGEQAAHALRRGWPCLVEKPLVIDRAQLDALRPALALPASARSIMGCNLRYLPSIRAAADAVAAGRLGPLVRAQFEVGQDLAQWRPGRDLSASYSADAALGGGVLRDLVHEVDLAHWLVGPLRVRAAVGARLGRCPLAADDVHVALLETRGGAPVTISLDYVSLQVVRRFTLVGQHATLCWDLPARAAWIDSAGGREPLPSSGGDFDVGATYVAEMADWLALLEDSSHVPALPLAAAVASMELMVAMGEAA